MTHWTDDRVLDMEQRRLDARQAEAAAKIAARPANVLDAIRRVVAEDAAHAGTTHEVYLRRETVAGVMAENQTYLYHQRRGTPQTVLRLPLHILPRESTRRDCIATIRGGQVISVTNL